MKLSELADMLINTLIRTGPLKYKPWQTERRVREIIARVIGPTFAQLEAENEALEENRIDLCVMMKEWQSLIHPSRLTDLNYDTNDLLDRNKSGTGDFLVDTKES